MILNTNGRRFQGGVMVPIATDEWGVTVDVHYPDHARFTLSFSWAEVGTLCQEWRAQLPASWAEFVASHPEDRSLEDRS